MKFSLDDCFIFHAEHISGAKIFNGCISNQLTKFLKIKILSHLCEYEPSLLIPNSIPYNSFAQLSLGFGLAGYFLQALF